MSSLSIPQHTESQLFVHQIYIIIKIRRKSLVFCVAWQLLSMDINSLISLSEQREDHAFISVVCNSTLDSFCTEKRDMLFYPLY